MRKTPKLMSVILIATLLAGLFLLSGSAFADTNSDKLQQMLEAMGLKNPKSSQYGDLWARLDRGQLVFGSPLLVPGNEWKKAPPDMNGQDWQTANGIDLGHPGEEPRYLGFTLQKDPFSNDWFPPDAEPGTPAKRNMIAEPWNVKSGGKNLCSDNPQGISDYTWGVIKAALADYHEKIGFSNPQDGFAYNPAFKGQFDINTIKRYFKVLSEPKPGVTGAVREWHYRNGVPWYDTITVNWDVLPNFILEDIDPSTQLARPGETYTGKVKVKAVPLGDFISDAQTWQLYQVMYGPEVHLQDSYDIPIGVAVGKSLTEMTVNQTVQPTDLPGVYTLLNIGEGEYEAEFKWQVPKDFAGKEITLASEVNATGLLPGDVHIDDREFVNADNFKSVKVPVDVKNLAVTNLKITPNPANQGDTVTVSADVENQYSQDIATKVQYRFNNNAVGERDITVPAHGSVPVSFTVTAPPPGKYSAGVLVNPNKDMPPDEINILSGDWPGDNLAWGWLNVQGVDISVTASTPKPKYVIPFNASSVQCPVNIVVTRKDNGDTVPVRVTLECPLGNRTFDITLEPGGKWGKPVTLPAYSPGFYPVKVQAWPVGAQDMNPGDNVVLLNIVVEKQKPPEIPRDNFCGVLRL